jgi:hypothetical protein
MPHNPTPAPRPNIHPGEHIITRHGTTRVVALALPNGLIFAYGPRGLEICEPVCDAWGGEHDLALGLAEAA